MALLGIDDPWLAWLSMAAVGAAVGVAGWLLLRSVVSFAARTKGDVDDKVALALHWPFAFLLALVAAGAFLARVSLRLTPGQAQGTGRLLAAFFIVAVAWTAVAVVRIFLEVTGSRRQRLLPATRVARRLLAVFVYTGAFLMVLQQYDISITPLLTGLGIAGLAAALALQDTLGNFFAGISVQTGQAIQPGHFVRVEKEDLEGYVEKVGWRTTSIRTLAGNTIVIPNSNLAQANVTDFYLPSPDMGISLDFVVGQESDPQRIITALMEEARESKKTNPGYEPGAEPFAFFAGYTDYALKFTLSVRVKEFVQQFQVRQDLNARVLQRFRKDGVRVPYPTRHDYQERVEPAATRVPGAPGGLAPQDRPPRPRHQARAEAPPQDPRVAEAEKAKEEIAAKQVEEEADAEG
jgi:small-conductance mechanosensitive channel